jgi:dimethylargininase
MKNTKKFTNAIVRKPASSIIKGLTTSLEGQPDHELALLQHKNYIKVLQRCGVEVIELEALEEYPDSVFVEDVAVCTEKCAVITNPGAKSRNQETNFMEPVLKEHFTNIEFIQAPGTLDGGDVMMAGDHFFIGLSDRTNRAGAEELIRILSKYGYSGSVIEIEGLLHLKTGVAYLENNIMLAHENLAGHPEFASYTKIIVPPEEEYAANAIRVNDFVLFPSGYPVTAEKLRRAGLQLIELPMSEFRKLDGGLSCLLLRW